MTLEEQEPEEARESFRAKTITPIIIKTITILKLLFELHLEHFRRSDADYQVSFYSS